MKLNIVNPSRSRGSVLLVTLVIAAVLGITLASYLVLVSAQSKSVARSQHWNQALVIAEAGVEDALALMNKFAGSPALTNWVSDSAVDSWTKPSANVYRVERWLDSAKTTRYVVYVTNMNTLNTRGIIHATGYVTLPSVLGANTTLERTVVVDATIERLFNVAMAALGAIDLKGNGVASDSFDSNDPNYSTNGLYDPLKRKAGGDIATNNTLTNSTFTVGNANVAGKIITGPTGTYSIGPNGVVGSIPWVDNAANKGKIEPGWAQNDMNVVFKDVVLPDTLWLPTGIPLSPAGGSGTVNGTAYDHIFAVPGDYLVTAGNKSIYVATNVSVRLRVTASTFNPPQIYVAGTGNTAGKMVAYLDGPLGSKAILGTEHQTQSGKAENMAFLGLPTLQDLSYKGNGDFTGVVYAPQAIFQLAGGGFGTIDFIGSSVTRTIQMNGHYHFHYDEDLKKNGPNIGYVATDWKEF